MHLCLAFLFVAAICHGKPVKVLFIYLLFYLLIYLFIFANLASLTANFS